MVMNPSDPNIARESKLHPFRNVAVAALFDSDGKLLMVRTKRFPDHWQPIGGGMKPGDQSPEHTLSREVSEEAGVRLGPPEFTHSLVTDYDLGEGKIHFFTASMPRSAVPQFDTAELEEWRWVTLDDALSLTTLPATRRFLEFLAMKSNE